MPTLKEIRLSKGLSMSDVEKGTGLHNTTISKVERGIINFTPRLYRILSEFYGTTDIDDEVKGVDVGERKPKEVLVQSLDSSHEFIDDDFSVLKKARKALGLTLKEVAQAVGLDPSTVAMFIQIASQYESKIYVEVEQKRVNAKSIMGMNARKTSLFAFFAKDSSIMPIFLKK